MATRLLNSLLPQASSIKLRPPQVQTPSGEPLQMIELPLVALLFLCPNPHVQTSNMKVRTQLAFNAVLCLIKYVSYPTLFLSRFLTNFYLQTNPAALNPQAVPNINITTTTDPPDASNIPTIHVQSAPEVGTPEPYLQPSQLDPDRISAGPYTRHTDRDEPLDVVPWDTEKVDGFTIVTATPHKSGVRIIKVCLQSAKMTHI